MRHYAFTSLLALYVLWAPSAIGEQLHQDSRCNCKCPDVSTVGGGGNINESIDDRHFSQLSATDDKINTRSIYINSSVAPDECDCKHVVIPILKLNETQAESFCPRCQCKYQVRSLTIIKVVVIVVIWVISILVIYMAFLQCLEPLLKRRGGAGAISARSGVSYREHRDSVNGPEDR